MVQVREAAHDRRTRGVACSAGNRENVSCCGFRPVNMTPDAVSFADEGGQLVFPGRTSGWRLARRFTVEIRPERDQLSYDQELQRVVTLLRAG